MAYQLANLRRDAITLVAHDDNAFAGQWLLINVLSIEQGAIDGNGSIA